MLPDPIIKGIYNIFRCALPVNEIFSQLVQFIDENLHPSRLKTSGVMGVITSSLDMMEARSKRPKPGDKSRMIRSNVPDISLIKS
jgi:hypothetical protein